MENRETPIVKRKALKSDDPLRAKINKAFLIRWRPQGQSQWQLVSAGKLASLIEKHAPTVRLGPQATAEKHMQDAWNCGQDRHRVLVRETIEILFISK